MYTYTFLSDFTKKLFCKIGCPEKDAGIIADVLIKAELRNIPSHGMIRIMDYIGLYEKNRINVSPDIKITHQTPSTAVVDGDNCFGMIVADFAMKLAIKKAVDAGTGWVAVRNSNHFGIAGYYSMLALEHDMIGISMTNANPLVAPTWSTSRLLGTNPLAVAIPANKQKPFVADFATTPIARGKLAVKAKLGEPVAEGFVQDKEGNASTNPDILKKGGAILPLGGDYMHGSHKGYCMGAIVDIFSAIFSGANFGPFVPPQVPYLPLPETSTGKGLGHFFGAIRIDAFQSKKEFKNKMDTWINTFKEAKTIKGQECVVIPGEPEAEAEEKNMKNGISLIPAIENELKKIAKKYGVNF